MQRKPPAGKGGELVRVGELDFIQKMAQAAALRITKADEKLINKAVEVRQDDPDPEDLAYMARELVQCTLPHSDPGQVPFWTRVNGNITLSIVSDFDPKTKKLVGYPYGSIPRLLLFWMTTEALRTGSRRLELGSSYGGFLRDIGLDPNTGGGKRGDANRVRIQSRRLFTSRISFIQEETVGGMVGEARLHMNVASKSVLWWDPKKADQLTLFESWVELGEEFYQAITSAPVPVDLRALHALKRSPLALDLYAWSTHKALSVARKGKPQFIPWKSLAEQFGADYAEHRNFKQKAKEAFRKIQAVYPGLKLGDASGGLVVLPTSRPAVAARPSRRALK